MISTILADVALPPVLAGAFRAEVRLADGPSVEAIAELSALVKAFFRLADLGAYVPAAAAPGRASCRVADEVRMPHGIAWRGHAQAVDWRFAQVFRNILVMFNQLHHPVWQFSLRADDSAHATPLELAPLGTRPMPATYPPLSLALPFVVERRDRGAASSSRRVAIEFAETLTQPNLSRTVDILELWSDVSLGGYASDEQDAWTGECAIFDAIPDIDDDMTVAMPIERFGAPDVAWFSMLNLCGRISGDVAPVVRVTIE